MLTNRLDPAQGPLLVVLGLICFFWFFFYHKKVPKSSHHRSLPWVGGYAFSLSQKLACWTSLWKGPALLNEAYVKFSKKGHICIVPSFTGPQVLLPPSHIPWLIAQPESVLSVKQAQFDAIEALYTMLDPAVVLNPVHEDIVRKEMKVRLAELTPELAEEAKLAVKIELGDSFEWSEKSLDKAVKKIICRTVNRVFVGAELCHETELIRSIIYYVESVASTGMLLKVWPRFFKPFISPIMALPTRYNFAKCAKYTFPYFEDRLHNLRNPSSSQASKVMDWLISNAKHNNDEKEQSAEMLTRRLLTLNFAAVHTSTMTMVNLLLDIASHSGCLENLKHECLSLAQLYGDEWTRKRLNSMVKLDSALRESMRTSSFISKGFNRKVVSRTGITLSDGTYFPYGTMLCASAYSIQHDEDYYPDPHIFQYDRFLQSDRKAQDASKKQEMSAMSAATTSEIFPGWGHGRHACPGRFFAVDMIKVIISCILEEYELKELERRPGNLWIGTTPIPSPTAKLKLKRLR